jgi:hypothetical protein
MFSIYDKAAQRNDAGLQSWCSQSTLLDHYTKYSTIQ